MQSHFFVTSSDLSSGSLQVSLPHGNGFANSSHFPFHPVNFCSGTPMTDKIIKHFENHQF